MASEIRVNQIQNRSGLSTVTFSDSGVVISGITTISDLRTSGNTIVAAGTTAAPSISPTGDSNTGIFFPSPDTVAIAEGGVEALRIDSSGRVGIGTNNPTVNLEVRNTSPTLRVTGNSATNPKITLSSATITSWSQTVSGSDSSFSLDRDGTGVLRATSTGNVEIANGNLVFSTAGKGIDFSATANSSGTMTSELLSDYEEGTWTPTLIAGGTVSGINQATYTRVGRLVTIYFYINTSSIPNNGTQFQIGGLPYTVIGGAHYSTGQIGYCGSFNLGPWRPIVITGGSYIYFHRIDGNPATLLNSGATGLTEILISLWYYVA